jgi:hypothetical protein
MNVLWFIIVFLAGMVTPFFILFVLRDVLPPTIFTPSDWK